jgi:hypothetical protein
MSDSRDFWLHLDGIANELEQEGDSDYERALSLSDWLSQMSVKARGKCLSNLELVVSALTELTIQWESRSAIRHSSDAS